MKLTYIYGSAVHLRNDRRREILKIPDAVGAKAGRYTGKLGSFRRYINCLVVRVWKPGSSIEIVPSFATCRCDRRGFGRDMDWDIVRVRAWATTDQGDGAICVLASVNE